MRDRPEAPSQVHESRGHALVRRLWQGQAPVLAAALLPAEGIFRVGQAVYHGAYDKGLLRRARPAVPTISVGNLTVGGAGKTPVTRWLVDELLGRGEAPAVLHGGYAADEPALHVLWHPDVPVYAQRDRRLSALQAVAGGASVLVLDDGFQHRRLARDLDVVLIAAETWRAHPRLLPRGPWREPPGALARAHVVAVTRKQASAERAAEVLAALARRSPRAAHVQLALVPVGWRRWPALGAGADEDVSADAGAVPRGVVVCGISDPEAFLANAAAAGAVLDATLVFPDHQAYGAGTAARIRRAAGASRAVLTTAKDAVKLAVAAPDLTIWVLEQQLRVEAGASGLATAIDRVLQAHRA
jgi:tetraacyldisaccharide 4'-kinase